MTQPEPAPNIVEAKVWASTLVTLGFAVFVAVGSAITEQPTLLDFLPPWLQYLALAGLPPLLTFAAGWAKTSNRV